MKKKIAVILLSCVSIFAIAGYFEINKKLPCGSIEEVVESLKEFDESPMWYGNVSDTVKTVLLVNPNTTTWSFIITADKSGCVLSSGTGYSYRIVNRGTTL